MKPERIFAVVSCMFVVASIVQGLMWHWRPEPGWHPAWWQSHTWAILGQLLAMPCAVLPVLLQELGVEANALLWASLAVGFALELLVVYRFTHACAQGVVAVVRNLSRSVGKVRSAT
jgi:hypothetical protein